MARVEERLDAAEDASKRIGRKDWLMAFNGAVFSLFLSDLIPQQAATHMVVMAISGLGTYLVSGICHRACRQPRRLRNPSPR